jgi:hypothetical protein
MTAVAFCRTKTSTVATARATPLPPLPIVSIQQAGWECLNVPAPLSRPPPVAPDAIALLPSGEKAWLAGIKNGGE